MSNLQTQYDLIHSFFKTTNESFDSLEWDGNVLNVVENEETIEKYTLEELKKLIPELQ